MFLYLGFETVQRMSENDWPCKEEPRAAGAFGDQGAFLKNRPLDPGKTFGYLGDLSD